jgi:hypothetical protein
MNTQAITAELPRRHRWPRWSPRLVSAEFLKLRKRRGLVVSAIVLTIVPMISIYTVLAILHASDPAQHGPAGGMGNFRASLNVLPLSVVAAILVGATLGSGDLSSGVFRELVVTGRSRLALFAARVPAGLALLIPIVGAAFAITATAATVLAGSQEARVIHGKLDVGNVAPSGSLLLQSAGWIALVTVVSMLLALGVSSLIGSRGTSIGVLLGWWVVAMPLLSNLAGLGSLRKGLALAALDRLAPAALFAGDPAVPMSLAAAVAVLVAWTVAPLALGAWSTCTRDA